MPRQTLDIRNFHTGLVSNPDAQDIPLDACVDMEAVSLDGQGKLIGLPTAGSDVGHGDGLIFPYAWIKKLDGKYTLVFTDGTDTKAVTDFYGTPATSTPISTSSANTMVTRGLGVHIGRGTANNPRWVGYVEHGQFSGSAPSGLQVPVAECSAYNGTSAGQFAISEGSPAGSGAGFIIGYRYSWAYSLIYDGIQESPLIEGSFSYDPGAANAGKYKPITVTAYGVASTNPRITGINLYRAESQNANTTDYGFYKLVTTIDINDASWTGTTNKTFTYDDYGKSTGASYEDNSGIPETATTTIVNYELSAEVNDYLFVGKCAVTGLPDAGHMLFRSKEFRYDTFDWANEHIKLPRVPTAMRGYNGQLVVWDTSTMFTVNPDRFYVMSSLDGAGCSNHKSAKVTPYGLFFANKQGAYVYDGSTVNKISDPIRNLWQAETATVEVNYDEKENLVLFHFGAECYYYHVKNGVWGYTSSLLASLTGSFQGKDGESYSVSATSVVSNFTGNSTRAWDWTSKELDFETWQDKKFYYLTVDGVATVTYGIDGASPSTSLVNTNEIGGGGSWRQGKTLTVKFVATSGNSVNRLEVIARELSPRTNTRVVIP